MRGFKGYYYRHQNGKCTVAFIVVKTADGGLIQMITDNGSRIFRFPQADVSAGKARLGNNRFGPNGINVSLPGIYGTLRYSHQAPLKTDIMGPFRFLPLECRHEIISMSHRLTGTLTIDSERYDFNGGRGYIEGDSGHSFPEKYMWVQANDFSGGESFFAALAEIPFCGIRFKGVICVLLVDGREYRLATYLGAKAKMVGDVLIVCQGKLSLMIEFLETGRGYNLSSPKNGVMKGMIKEHNNSTVRITIFENGMPYRSLISHRAGVERFGKI